MREASGQPGPKPFEPSLLNQLVREEAGVVLRRAERLAQLAEGYGRLTAPLEVEVEVEDDLRFVLGEAPLHGLSSRAALAFR